jgi:hypothetical protein
MSDAPPPPKDSAPATDVLLLHSPTADGEGVRVVRARDGHVELGEVRPLKEGAPIVSGEVVELTSRTENPSLCDVRVQYKAPPRASDASAPAHKGPALVNSGAYRDHWDGIFRKKAPSTAN